MDSDVAPKTPEPQMDDQPAVAQVMVAELNGKTLPPPAKRAISEPAAPMKSPAEDFDATEALLLLLVGAILEGNDALLARLRRWQAETATAGTTSAGVTTKRNTHLPAYSLLGLLLQSPAALRRQRLLAVRLSQTLFGLVTLPLRPVAGSRFLQPARRRFDALVSEGESVIAAWTAAAETEEPRARAMAQTATNDLIDDVIRHLSENPELAEMIQTQSVGLAGEVTDNIRSRTVTADTAAERLARTLLRRQPRTIAELEAETEADERTAGV